MSEDNSQYLQYFNQLETDKFEKMLDDPTQCYKFYWLDALLTHLAAGDDTPSFEDIIDEMICDAWHSVTRYHLHLGPQILDNCQNYLEQAIRKLETIPDIVNANSREKLCNEIKSNSQMIHEEKIKLARHVPYRVLASFLEDIDGSNPIWDQKKRLINYICTVGVEKKFFYTIEDKPGLNKRILIDPDWKAFVLDNYAIIKNWIQLKKVRYLQDRNPGVPGIIYKLDLEYESVRHLAEARKLWQIASKTIHHPIINLYSGVVVDMDHFVLDHFIPWSYVANDELWNLIPTDQENNSRKSNKLPNWKKYHHTMASNQFLLYESVFTNEKCRAQFEKCRRKNLNAIWASENLYVEGHSQEKFIRILTQNLKPLYDAAKMQGYKVWKDSAPKWNEHYE